MKETKVDVEDEDEENEEEEVVVSLFLLLFLGGSVVHCLPSWSTSAPPIAQKPRPIKSPRHDDPHTCTTEQQ